MPQLLDEQKTVAKGTFWSLSGTMVLKLVSFFFTVLIARLFTQDDVGTFYLALSIMYVVAIFGDLGLNQAFTRYVPFFIGKGQKDKAYMLLRSAYLYSGTLSLIFSVVLFFLAGTFAAFFQNPALEMAVQFIAFFIVINTFFVLNSQFLVGLKKMKENALLLNSQNILKLVFTIILFFLLGTGAYIISFAFTASYLVIALISFWFVNKEIAALSLKGIKASFHEQIGMLKDVVPFGLMLASISAIMGIASYTDRLMIGYFQGPEVSATNIAIYSIAVSLGLLIMIFPGAVVSIFLPVVSEMFGGKREEDSKGISSTALRWSIFLMVPLTVLMIVFPEDLLQMFFGALYAPGALVLAVFSFGVFIRSLSYVHGMLLASRRIVRVELFAAIVAMILNVSLNYALIPVYGIEGAAAASAISFIAITLILVHFCRKLAGFGFPTNSLKPVLAGLVPLAALFLARPFILGLIGAIPEIAPLDSEILNIIFQKGIKLIILGALFVASAGIYMLTLIIFRIFQKEDSELASAAMRKIGVPQWASSLAIRIMGG